MKDEREDHEEHELSAMSVIHKRRSRELQVAQALEDRELKSLPVPALMYYRFADPVSQSSRSFIIFSSDPTDLKAKERLAGEGSLLDLVSLPLIEVGFIRRPFLGRVCYK